MQTHQINVSRARDMVQEIRRDLFAFPEVLDVFVTGRPDWLVVVSRGRPRPGEWLRALRAVGYHVPVRRHATQAAGADRHHGRFRPPRKDRELDCRRADAEAEGHDDMLEAMPRRWTS